MAATLIRALDDPGYDPGELAHYIETDARWRRGRAQSGPLRNLDGTMAAVPAFMRLDYRTDRNGPVPEYRPDLGPCWLWLGATNKGYGYIGIGKRSVQAYRVNYERWVGPIPEGAHLDHLCRVRRCVNPTHLEPVTPRENIIRSPIHLGAVRAARTECPAGHLFDEENTYWWRGERHCRSCQRENKRRATGAAPRKRATDTHCAAGHPWEGNLCILPSGRRQCATCNREGGQRFRDRQRAAAE